MIFCLWMIKLLAKCRFSFFGGEGRGLSIYRFLNFLSCWLNSTVSATRLYDPLLYWSLLSENRTSFDEVGTVTFDGSGVRTYPRHFKKDRANAQPRSVTADDSNGKVIGKIQETSSAVCNLSFCVYWIEEFGHRNRVLEIKLDRPCEDLLVP